MKIIFMVWGWLFFVVYMMSFMFVMLYEDWFLMWLGLEVNMISFILVIYRYKDMGSVESCLKYFFVQSIGSALLMFFYYSGVLWAEECSVLVLAYKLGMGPFFFWFVGLCRTLDWLGCGILMTLQKVLPLYIMSSMESDLVWGLILMSLVVGCVGSFNQSNLKVMLGYSSVHHMGWMVVGMLYKGGLWTAYVGAYVLMLMPIIVYLKWSGCYKVEDTVSSSVSWLFLLSILSLGGMPPFLGFLIKMWVFYYMGGVNFFLFSLMVVISVIMLYIYARMVYGILMGVVGVGWFDSVSKEEVSSGMDVYMGVSLVMGVVIGFMLA